jgi:hypothetical protein
LSLYLIFPPFSPFYSFLCTCRIKIKKETKNADGSPRSFVIYIIPLKRVMKGPNRVGSWAWRDISIPLVGLGLHHFSSSNDSHQKEVLVSFLFIYHTIIFHSILRFSSTHAFTRSKFQVRFFFYKILISEK